MLIGNKAYTAGKANHFPFKWSHICQEHSFVRWAAELRMSAAPMKDLPNVLSRSQTASLLFFSVAVDSCFWVSVTPPPKMKWINKNVPVPISPCEREPCSSGQLIWTGPINKATSSPGTICKVKAQFHVRRDVRDRLRSGHLKNTGPPEDSFLILSALRNQRQSFKGL